MGPGSGNVCALPELFSFPVAHPVNKTILYYQLVKMVVKDVFFFTTQHDFSVHLKAELL